MRIALRVLITLVMVLLAIPAVAQGNPNGESGLSGWLTTFARSFKDQTTYFPASFLGVSAAGDWYSSQTFFQHGVLEMNSRFTRDGASPGTPVSFGDGVLTIVKDSAVTLGISVLNNGFNNITSRILVNHFPKHPKLIRVASRVEKIGFAIGASWYLSSRHFEQWELNNQVANQRNW